MHYTSMLIEDISVLEDAAQKLNNIYVPVGGVSHKLELALGLFSEITDPTNEWHIPRRNTHFLGDMIVERWPDFPGGTLFRFSSAQLFWGKPIFDYTTILGSPWVVDDKRIKGIESVGGVEKITYLDLYTGYNGAK